MSFGLLAAQVVGPYQILAEFGDDTFDPATVGDADLWTLTETAPTPVPPRIIRAAVQSNGLAVALDVFPPLSSGALYTLRATAAKSGGGAGASPDSIVVETGLLSYAAPGGLVADTFVGVPPSVDVPEVDLFSYLTDSIRKADEAKGGGFLKRLLARPSELQADLVQKIARIPYLVDPTRCPAAVLQFLRAIVGFGAGSGLPDEIASRLGETDLRRLILIAVPYWMRRGRRSALSDSIRVLAGGLRPAIDDWFALRTLIDEGLLGVEGGPGVDAWGVEAGAGDVEAGEADGPAALSIRVADLGTLDRTLVEDLAELARPAGERYELAFVDFLDTFADGRLSHWIPTVFEDNPPSDWIPGDSSTTPVSLPGLLFHPGGRERISTARSAAWRDYVASMIVNWRDSGQFEFRFYYKDSRNYYAARFADPDWVRLVKRVNNVETVLVAVPAGSVDLDVPAARLYRVEALEAEGGGVQIRVWIDGDLVAQATDSSLQAGTIEVWVDDATADEAISIHRVEVFQIPLDVRNLLPETASARRRSKRKKS